MKRLKEIETELREIRDREVIRLFRIARRASERECSETVRIQREAWQLQRTQPGDLLDPFRRWEYAFKFSKEE